MWFIGQDVGAGLGPSNTFIRKFFSYENTKANGNSAAILDCFPELASSASAFLFLQGSDCIGIAYCVLILRGVRASAHNNSGSIAQKANPIKPTDKGFTDSGQ